MPSRPAIPSRTSLPSPSFQTTPPLLPSQLLSHHRTFPEEPTTDRLAPPAPTLPASSPFHPGGFLEANPVDPSQHRVSILGTPLDQGLETRVGLLHAAEYFIRPKQTLPSPPPGGGSVGCPCLKSPCLTLSRPRVRPRVDPVLCALPPSSSVSFTPHFSSFF